MPEGGNVARPLVAVRGNRGPCTVTVYLGTGRAAAAPHSVYGSACLKTTRTGGRRTGRAERGRGVHHLRGVGRGEPAVERCRQGVTGRCRRRRPRRPTNGDVSAARRCCGHASTSARASCATRRASCSGTGVRAAGVDETSTIWAAVSGLVRHPAWATSGRAPVRVHTQKATQRSSTSSGAMAPRRSSGSVPAAMSGRRVTPTVGKSTTAPRCTASPAPRG